MTSASNPLGYLGSMFTPGNPVDMIIRDRDPTASDRDYRPGQQWLNRISFNSFTFQGIDANGAVWEQVDNPKMNPGATTNPTVNDDSTQGYGSLSFWCNNTSNTIWGCADPVAGAAVWQNLSAGGGGGGIPTIGSSTDNALVRWDGAAGAAVQNSNAVLTDAGSLTLALPLGLASGGTGAVSLTANGLLLGNGTSAISAIAAATTDQVLFGVTGSAPVWGSLIAGSGISIVGKTISATGGTGDVVGPASSVDNTLPRYDGVTGKLIQGSGIVVSDTNDVTGVGALTVNGAFTLVADQVQVSEGGTGGASFTANAVLLGNGTSALSSAGAQSDGQLLIGRSGLAPVAAALTAGTNISITNGVGSITIDCTAAGLAWTDVSGTSATMAVNNGYQANNAALVTLTLPAVAAFGSIIRVKGAGAGGWRIAQPSGVQVIAGTQSTTVGVTGMVDSTQQYDAVELFCAVANTTWHVLSSFGNPNYV